MHREPPGAGQRAHHERLAAAGRSVEQNTPGRVDAEPLEGVRMLQRPQHGFCQSLFGGDHIADIVEGDRPDGDLFGGRAGERADHRQRANQILLGERWGTGLLAGARGRAQRRLSYQCCQIGYDKTGRA
ncbi:Uncharacterised protein [Mycobacteroides abscessus subsp. abscessus]|nr:Uncharacterised protein [Mycobacteroides abscessus subsp. abscessus]